MDHASFLQHSRISVAIAENRNGGWQVRLERRVDRSTVSFLMRRAEAPSIAEALEELRWLMRTLGPEHKTSNRLLAFFTDEESALLKADGEIGPPMPRVKGRFAPLVFGKGYSDIHNPTEGV